MRLHAHISECTRHRYLCTFPNILSFVNIQRKEQLDKRKKNSLAAEYDARFNQLFQGILILFN